MSHGEDWQGAGLVKAGSQAALWLVWTSHRGREEGAEEIELVAESEI